MAYCCKYSIEHSDLIKCSEFFQGVGKVSFPKRTVVHEVRKLKIFWKPEYTTVITLHIRKLFVVLRCISCPQRTYKKVKQSRYGPGVAQRVPGS